MLPKFDFLVSGNLRCCSTADLGEEDARSVRFHGGLA